MPHSLPGSASTVSHTTSPPTLFTPLVNSVLPSPPDHCDTWAPQRDRAFTLGPALTHYRCQRVYVVSRYERITLTLAHFPLPLFHFAASELPPPPTPDPSPTRPSPTLDGTDLIGRVYTIDYSPTSSSPCMTLYAKLCSCHAFSPLSFSSGCGSASSPAVYTPPVPYPDPSIPTTLSTPVSPAEKTWIQQVVGSLLFYARALDLSVHTSNVIF
jgi:hypothetical protein